MRKVECIGTVVGLEGELAVVEFQPADGCGIRMSCACCSSLRPRQIRVPRQDLREGDPVRLSVSAYSGYLSTLVVFVLPLALAVAGSFVGWALEGRKAAHDLGILVGGLVGFAAAWPVVIALNRRLDDPAKIGVQKARREDSPA